MVPTSTAPRCHSQIAIAPAPAISSALRTLQQRAEHGQQPLRGEEHVGVAVDRVAHVVVFVARPREQLDGEDVGVAVDDAADQRGARLRVDLGAVAHARHEIPEQRDIAGEPAEDRQREPGVGGCRHDDRGDAVDQHVPERGDRGDQRLAHRRAGLHHAVGDAAGEIVLEERPALPHHVPVRLPADQAGERRRNRLVGDEIAQQGDDRARDQHHQRHAGEPRPGLGEEPVGRNRGHQRDDAAHEPGHRAVGERDEELDHEQGDEQPFRLAGEMPKEGEQPGRRLRVLRNGGRLQIALEGLEHEFQFGCGSASLGYGVGAPGVNLYSPNCPPFVDEVQTGG